jgi:hypothetical protein
MDEKMKDERNNEAVVGIVTAILLVGLLVTVLSIIQTVYVPQWMEEIEKEHMDIVASQFSELKHTLDIQIYKPSLYNIPITTPITLGSNNVPYFLSRRSSGSLEIKDDAIQIEINGDTTDTYLLKTVEYDSVNSYYNDQTLIYEAGAVILSQKEGSLLVSKPFISITNESIINISCTLVDITSISGKTSAYGSHTCSILTNYSSSVSSINQNVTDITITTSYIKPWKEYFNTSLSNKGFTEGTDYYINETVSSFTVDFQSASKIVYSSVTKITMNAQIAPGWIR